MRLHPRYGRKTLLLCMPLLLMALLWWLLMFSPWLYRAPVHWPAPAVDSEQVLFVYGTLRYAWLRALIIRGHLPGEHARLEGFRRHALDLVLEADASVNGLRLHLSGAELIRLDRYERLGHRYYRDCLPLRDGSRAWVYRRLPDASELPPVLAECR